MYSHSGGQGGGGYGISDTFLGFYRVGKMGKKSIGAVGI